MKKESVTIPVYPLRIPLIPTKIVRNMTSLCQRIPDVPDPIGKENALRRAKQLAELRWTHAEAMLPAGRYLIIGLYKNAFGIYSTKPSSVFEVKKPE